MGKINIKIKETDTASGEVVSQFERDFTSHSKSIKFLKNYNQIKIDRLVQKAGIDLPKNGHIGVKNFIKMTDVNTVETEIKITNG